MVAQQQQQQKRFLLAKKIFKYEHKNVLWKLIYFQKMISYTQIVVTIKKFLTFKLIQFFRIRLFYSSQK